MNPTDTNAGGWEASAMRSWLNSDFLALLPDDLCAITVAARKRTNNAGEVMCANDTSVVTKTADWLWLLSMSEIYGRLAPQGDYAPWSPAIYDAEGAQYKFYADWGVTIKNYGSCRKKSGANSWWWLRSPDAVGSHYYHFVFDDGGWGWDASLADYVAGVSPGFCL